MAMQNYIARALGGAVRQALEQFPVVVITGLRQSGKSTFLQNEAGLSDRHYTTLDDIEQLAAARRDPSAFADRDYPVTVDEAQKCPELLPAIKRLVDKRRRPGHFILSGSANFALLKSITETLAGRAIYFELEPFTRRELAKRRPATAVLRQVFDGAKIAEESPAEQIGVREVILGGLPQVRLHPSTDPSLWFRGYVQTYLERDVRELSRLIDLVAFRDVVRLAALRTGQVLNSSELARDAKQNSTTTSRYLSVLETSFVIRRLTPYLANRASRIIKSPKLYMTDSGLAAHLIGLTQADAAQDPCWGALLESYVAQNLAGILAAEWPGAKLHYWHVQGRYEVDFVIESGRDCMAIEVKASPRWNERDLLGLVSFLHKTPRCRAGVLAYSGRDTIHLGDRLWAVPMPVLLA
jgi:uncharacterized protein